VILGLMALDKSSYFNANPSFTPGVAGYRMGDMILAADAIDPRARVKPADPEAPADPAAPEAPDAPGAPEVPDAPEAPEAPDAGAPEVLQPAKLPADEVINPAAVSAVDSASLTAAV
jgi:hypothetical protein